MTWLVVGVLVVMFVVAMVGRRSARARTEPDRAVGNGAGVGPARARRAHSARGGL